MPKTSPTRKVTKVARTGGGRTKRGQTSWFYPTLLTTVVIVGTFLIIFSRNQRQPDTSPPRIGADHWHSAIGFNVCGQFLQSIPDNGQDPLGIHTHGDGVIHTHPFSSQAAGRNARLKLYFDTVGADVSEDSFKLPNEEATHRNGQKCGDKDARVVMKVWETRSPDDKGLIFEGDPGELRLGNNQLITIALLPEGDEIPKPPSEAQLDNLSDVPGATTTTTAPATTPTTEETTTTSPPAP